MHSIFRTQNIKSTRQSKTLQLLQYNQSGAAFLFSLIDKMTNPSKNILGEFSLKYEDFALLFQEHKHTTLYRNLAY